MSKTVTVSKSNVALAVGVLGVLVLIGSETFAAEPASKRKAGPTTSAQTIPIRSMNASHRLNRAPATQAAWKNVGGLKNETDVIENTRRPGSLTAAPSQPTAYEGKPVATYNLYQAWPSKVAPPPPAAENSPSAANGGYTKTIPLTMSLPGAVPDAAQPGAYQVISAGRDGQATASDRKPNWMHIESLSWSTGSTSAPATETLDIAHQGLLDESKNEIATEAITIVSERMQRESASADSGTQLGDLRELRQIDVNK